MTKVELRWKRKAARDDVEGKGSGSQQARVRALKIGPWGRNGPRGWKIHNSADITLCMRICNYGILVYFPYQGLWSSSCIVCISSFAFVC